MKSKNLKTAAQLLIVCLIAFAACKKEKSDYFRITVNSISAPAIGRCVPDSIPIRLHGYIGPNKCHVFEEALFVLGAQNNIIIDAYGKKVGGTCGSEESFLDDVVYIFISNPGIYTFYDYNKPDIELGKIEVIK